MGHGRASQLSEPCYQCPCMRLGLVVPDVQICMCSSVRVHGSACALGAHVCASARACERVYVSFVQFLFHDRALSPNFVQSPTTMLRVGINAFHEQIEMSLHVK